MSDLFKESESISLEQEVLKIKEMSINSSLENIPELNMLANSDKVVNNNSIIASEKNDSSFMSNSDSNSDSKLKSTVSSNISSDVSSKKNKKNITKDKQSRKENKDDTIFREKSQYLFDISQLNRDYQWSVTKYTIDNTLEDLKAEFLRIKQEKQLKLQVQMFQQVLVMGVKGVELANSYFNPLNIDLDGWSESMQYAVADHSYQDVLRELAEKYKGVGNVSPELKLLGLIVFSGATHVGLKKMQNMFQMPQQQQQERRRDSSVSESKIPRPEEATMFSKDEMEKVLQKMKEKEVPSIKKRGRPAKV